MKNNIQFTVKFFLALFLFASCDIDEEYPGDSEFKLSQNDGYMPLTVENQWNYRAYLADIDPTTGVIDYDDDYLRLELMLANTKKITKNGEKQVHYEFSPISTSGIFGKFFGNLSKVYKDDEGNYFKSEPKRLFVTQGNSRKKEVVFQMNDIAFLKDNPIEGEILEEKFETLEVNFGKKAFIDYKIVSQITGVYNKIPPVYASEEGIDSHLNSFDEIIKVTDYIEIVSVRSNIDNVNVYMKGTLTGEPDVEGGMFVETETFQTGSLCVLPIDLGGNGCTLDGRLNEVFIFMEPEFSLIRQFGNSRSCPTVADLEINETFDVPLEVISNQKIFTRDVFYAKGVGPIKVIISTHDLLGEIKVEQTNEFVINVKQEAAPTPPGEIECKLDVDYGDIAPDPCVLIFCDDTKPPHGTLTRDGYGRMELLLDIEALLDNLVIDVPLSFDLNKSIVLNLHNYDINEL